MIKSEAEATTEHGIAINEVLPYFKPLNAANTIIKENQYWYLKEGDYNVTFKTTIKTRNNATFLMYTFLIVIRLNGNYMFDEDLNKTFKISNETGGDHLDFSVIDKAEDGTTTMSAVVRFPFHLNEGTISVTYDMAFETQPNETGEFQLDNRIEFDPLSWYS